MIDAAIGTVVEVTRLGAQGDGMVETPGGPVYLPFALPGELWRMVEGRAPERLTASGDRRQPVCRHFGQCGGCVAQHMSAQLYRSWKEVALQQAFAHRGLEVRPEPMRSVAARSRRRAFFGVARRAGEVTLGFREEGRHALVDLAECAVLDPAIVAALPALRGIARLILPADAGGRLIVTRVDDGLDVAFDGGQSRLGPDARAASARRAAEAGLQRLTVDGEIVYMDRVPSLMLGGVRVELPTGAFLQAVPEAEALMIELVMGAVGKARHVVDLFSGLGTFALPLARRARVLAVDGQRRSIEALEKAARGAVGLKPVSTKVRDLMREPLSRGELEAFDAAVLDPPRAGAKSQAETLARSSVATVVMVSCSPATLARDARTLVDGGYRLKAVTPVDQFIYSPHLEAVAVLRR
ncbi:MAG: class I SAM-dependent RNA methyltransferase [Hyphomicrobiaceae bacterium]|nr:class I SAM-dependent RNA methyltransferase [Hyphomicrobiaceae bacterium]